MDATHKGIRLGSIRAHVACSRELFEVYLADIDIFKAISSGRCMELTTPILQILV